MQSLSAMRNTSKCSDQQTTPEVPEGQPAEFGQGNQQATSEVSEEQSASFLNQPATSQGEMEATLQLETVEVMMMKRLLLVKRKI